MRPAVIRLSLALLLSTGISAAGTWSSGGIITPAERSADIRIKDRRIQALIGGKGLDALLLTRVRNQAWALGGADMRIVLAETESPVWLLYTSSGRKYLISNNIEAGRLMREENLASLGVSIREYPWFQGLTSGKDQRWLIVEQMLGGGRVGADGPVPRTEDMGREIVRARFPLTEAEVKRYRWLGQQCGRIVGDVCRELVPGMTELQVGAMLSEKLHRLGITPTVVLIGADNRLLSWRHLTPTDAKLREYVLVNLCAERWGLVVAVSRLVHFGTLSPDLASRIKACAKVDAAYLHASRPGATFGEIFKAGSEMYGKTGFPSEWKSHHQGGPIAYFEREFLASPDETEKLVAGTALAWNPTIRGVKVEDTVLVGEDGPEVLTPTPDWPMIEVMIDGRTYKRPGILVRSLGN